MINFKDGINEYLLLLKERNRLETEIAKRESKFKSQEQKKKEFKDTQQIQKYLNSYHNIEILRQRLESILTRMGNLSSEIINALKVAGVPAGKKITHHTHRKNGPLEIEYNENDELIISDTISKK